MPSPTPSRLSWSLRPHRKTAHEAAHLAESRKADLQVAEAAVVRSAQEASRADVAAARAAAKAWRERGRAIASVSKKLPKLGLMNPASGLASSLSTHGTLPVAWAAASRLMSAGFGATSAAGRALSRTLGSLGRGVLSIEGQAVTAAGDLAYELGAGAVRVLESLGSAAVTAAGKVARIGKNVAIEGAVVGALDGVAGAHYVQKSIASPQRPCDDVSGLDAPLRQPHRDAADLLHRPADQRGRGLVRPRLFGGGALA